MGHHLDNNIKTDQRDRSEGQSLRATTNHSDATPVPLSQPCDSNPVPLSHALFSYVRESCSPTHHITNPGGDEYCRIHQKKLEHDPGCIIWWKQQTCN